MMTLFCYLYDTIHSCIITPTLLIEWDYITVLILFVLSFGIGALLFNLSLWLYPQNAYPEKILGYECGFNPYNDARLKFDIHFYLVAILFILFDLEVLFLFPWIVSFSYFWTFYPFAIFSGFIFLIILTLGFIYEWKQGALDWW